MADGSPSARPPLEQIRSPLLATDIPASSEAGHISEMPTVLLLRARFARSELQYTKMQKETMASHAPSMDGYGF